MNVPPAARDHTAGTVNQVAIPLAWTDRPSAPFTLSVQLNADDYRRYFAAAQRRQSSWSNTVIFAIALFAAIGVALAFRAVASLETSDRAVIEIVGRYSLFAYALGVLVFLLVGVIVRRRSVSSLLAGTPHTFDPKIIVLDDEAVSITGKLSEVRWTWPAFTQLTVAKDLLCVWIGSQNGVLIPDRAFATEEMRKSVIAFVEAKIAAAKQRA